jgi:type IV secretion system protein VirB9
MRRERGVQGCWVRQRAALGLLGFVLSLMAHAEVLPQRGDVDPRIRTAAYSANEVYRLYGYVGYHIDLEFEADETFASISGGDLEGLTFSAHANVLTLKPKVVSTEMNLAVTTSKRRYYFEYSASARRPDGATDPVMYVVRFSYPAEHPSGADQLTDEQRIALRLTSAREKKPRNTDYWFCGDRTVKPVAVSDDGVQTRLTFAARSELPVLFVRNDDGTESLLNFSIDQGDVLIHRVAPRFIVRRGRLTGCIVNKGFVGSGELLKSGTVTPDVTRERKDVRP